MKLNINNTCRYPTVAVEVLVRFAARSVTSVAGHLGSGASDKLPLFYRFGWRGCPAVERARAKAMAFLADRTAENPGRVG